MDLDNVNTIDVDAALITQDNVKTIDTDTALITQAAKMYARMTLIY